MSKNLLQDSIVSAAIVKPVTKAPSIRTLDGADLERLIRPVKADFELFDRELTAMMKGDSPLITSIARHLLNSKGKRIRPGLVFLSSHAANQYTELSVLASLAIELIHTATLLHDDVVDDSQMRRNQETVNFKWTNLISVLMGDYLFAKAFKVMVKVGSMELIAALSSATERVSVGELRQIEETGNYDLSEQEYLKVISDKTASLFEAACQVGPILTEQSAEVRERFSKFGEALGQAFQITDDLLDLVGEASDTGKEPGNDMLTGKVTLPLIYALQDGDRYEAEKMRAVLENGVTSEDFPEVLGFIRRQGGIDYAFSRARQIADKGFAELSDLEDSIYYRSLSDMTRFSMSRAG